MALLSEVYGRDFMKRVKKKERKPKKEKRLQNDPLSPLDPQEMDKELLADVFDDSLRPNERVRGLKTSVYSDDKHVYQPIHNPNVLTYENQFDVFEEQPVRLSKTTSLGFDGSNASGEKSGPIDILNDPDYQEFLEFKKQREKTHREPVGITEGFTNDNDQFNELLLYIFTGFFMLLLFDNIYRLGRDSY
jgi:hypothetical protein